MDRGMNRNYELVIIGAGPAGLSASLYASRYGINHMVIGEIQGGQISETHLIDNYLGIPDVSGNEFSQKITKHVKKYGINIFSKKVKNIKKKGEGFEIKIEGGDTFFSQAIILATGMEKKQAGINGEEKFLGKGVSYCATCDGFFYKNKTVAIVGGGDSAAGAALFLGDIAEKIYLIYRKEKLRAEPWWQEKIKENKKIEIIYSSLVQEIKGNVVVEKIKIINQKNKKIKELNMDGIFIEIGHQPKRDLMYEDIKIIVDEDGYIKTDGEGKTNQLGIWAAGDLTTGSNKFKQVITAAAEGAIATQSVFQYLKKNGNS
ncbi:MAG: hypothetical protein COU40_01410 [Candidatus Moranbacteria bacterium CG10_big_fil_rev_8_21_14_0_10_35_21]|nr:MAG: hypothetical protein COU40_01410 [Candidatus Moranbacteria bacterium CG10_big_fil_rev_8_21_14_0_10_35_21]PJA88992.1 MAG: hypothetical protein CO139_00235 [Candidatus Moranbacteria bacterium CG_4_9_14_3_um_filter_36_9]